MLKALKVTKWQGAQGAQGAKGAQGAQDAQGADVELRKRGTSARPCHEVMMLAITAVDPPGGLKKIQEAYVCRSVTALSRRGRVLGLFWGALPTPELPKVVCCDVVWCEVAWCDH